MKHRVYEEVLIYGAKVTAHIDLFICRLTMPSVNLYYIYDWNTENCNSLMGVRPTMQCQQVKPDRFPVTQLLFLHNLTKGMYHTTHFSPP